LATNPVSLRLWAIYITLPVDFRVDLVGDSVIALIALEADVVRAGADPERLSFYLHGRFPESQMMARGDHRHGLGMRVAEILGTAEQVEHRSSEG
jgi:hypothetical protein